jgi:hypothetical protein
VDEPMPPLVPFTHAPNSGVVPGLQGVPVALKLGETEAVRLWLGVSVNVGELDAVGEAVALCVAVSEPDHDWVGLIDGVSVADSVWLAVPDRVLVWVTVLVADAVGVAVDDTVTVPEDDCVGLLVDEGVCELDVVDDGVCVVVLVDDAVLEPVLEGVLVCDPVLLLVGVCDGVGVLLAVGHTTPPPPLLPPPPHEGLHGYDPPSSSGLHVSYRRTGAGPMAPPVMSLSHVDSADMKLMLHEPDSRINVGTTSQLKCSPL